MGKCFKSKKLNEGASNFWSMKDLPLLIFGVFRRFYYSVRLGHCQQKRSFNHTKYPCKRTNRAGRVCVFSLFTSRAFAEAKRCTGASSDLYLSGKYDNIFENKKKILEVIENGKAYEKFKELVKNQGGDLSYIENFSDNAIKSFNEVINSYDDYTIIDVYNTLDENKYLNIDPLQGKLDPHPNITGHKKIYELYLKELAYKVVYEDEMVDDPICPSCGVVLM